MVFSVGYGAVEHHFLWEESFSAVSKEHFSLIDEQVMKPRTESNLGTFLFLEIGQLLCSWAAATRRSKAPFEQRDLTL